MMVCINKETDIQNKQMRHHQRITAIVVISLLQEF